MTSGSRFEKVSSPRSVGGFHGVQACSGVFQAPSYCGVDGTRISSWGRCLARSFLGGNVFPHGAMRWTG
jgi:hypothetical protein